ncbi:MAG: hypothetical protein R3B68_04460 [Phycisphaerales bacterium]
MSEHAPSSQAKARTSPRMNPAALSVGDAVRVLARVGGGEVTEAMLRADIEAGAPTNADGTINLVHYTAWLVKELSGGARGDD